jgi:ribosome-binding ATPase YchF (GTP1/OBG family)
MDITEEERLMISDLHLLTNKPFIYAVNLTEDKINTPESELRTITGILDTQIPVLPVSAKIEMDMLEFSEEDKKMFLTDLGIDFNPMDTIIKTCYDLLGLQYYFTAGEIEVRAWTIKK